MKKTLKINYQKTCDCPANHISCITAKDWLRGMVTIKEFYYEARDIRDKTIHPAMFPISLPAHFIQLLTHKGELALDPFAGSGLYVDCSPGPWQKCSGFRFTAKVHRRL